MRILEIDIYRSNNGYGLYYYICNEIFNTQVNPSLAWYSGMRHVSNQTSTYSINYINRNEYRCRILLTLKNKT